MPEPIRQLAYHRRRALPGNAPTAISAETLNERGIAHLTYDTYEIAADSMPRKGKLYDLYGSDADGTGALMAWAWAVHRIIDALKEVPELDETKVGVNGFSRWGKAALLAGAFDERVALTVPSSSGQAGVGSYRSAEQADDEVQTLSQILDEAPHWFGDLFSDFRGRIDQLPFDGHTVCALVAPRPLIATEGGSDYWNNPPGPALSMQAAKIVYDYLGVSDHIGFKSSANASHEMTDEQMDAILTFAARYLLGSSIPTEIFDEPYGSPPEDLLPWSAP